MLNALLDLFYPEICAGCGELLIPEEPILCISCRHCLPFARHCLNLENEAFSKFYGKVTIESVQCLLYYEKEGIVQNCIHNLKYRGRQEFGVLAARLFASELKQSALQKDIDKVIPVPLHLKRMKKRGYNQVAQFALTIAELLDTNYSDNLLTREIFAETQAKKGRSGRASIEKSTFAISPSPNLENQHFLLVDDVLTTGATLEACARQLLKIPGSKVSIACIAYSHS